MLLDERKGVSYPSGFQADDGTIYVSYDRKRKEQAEMLLARFTEEDVLADKGVSERFAQRLLINKTHGFSRKLERISSPERMDNTAPSCCTAMQDAIAVIRASSGCRTAHSWPPRILNIPMALNTIRSSAPALQSGNSMNG